jgi:ribosome-associated translation inhibitor RaiA
MTNPTQVTFHGLDHSDAAAQRVHEHVDKLARHNAAITRCDVTIEAPHRHQRQGRQFHVRIELAVPGRTLVVSRDPGEAAAHDDVYVALRDAFDAARRQLDDLRD